MTVALKSQMLWGRGTCVMMRESLKTRSSEYIAIYQDDLYIASTTHEAILNILQDKSKININPDFYLEGNYPHTPGGTMICQLMKYLEMLYVNITILFNDKLPTDQQFSIKIMKLLIAKGNLNLTQTETTYVPLNKSNVGICFTASGYKQFRAFATLCGMPATFISDDEADEPIQMSANAPITMTLSETPMDQPQCSASKGVTTDFTVNPTIIPPEDQDEPLLRSDQAPLMRLHQRLGHCSFAQLKHMAEQGIIPRKFAKVPPPKCPSCLYGKAH